MGHLRAGKMVHLVSQRKRKRRGARIHFGFFFSKQASPPLQGHISYSGQTGCTCTKHTSPPPANESLLPLLHLSLFLLPSARSGKGNCAGVDRSQPAGRRRPPDWCLCWAHATYITIIASLLHQSATEIHWHLF